MPFFGAGRRAALTTSKAPLTHGKRRFRAPARSKSGRRVGKSGEKIDKFNMSDLKSAVD